VTGKQYVGYWLHNAHLSIDGTKIAKSLGNGIRLSGLMDRGIPPLAYRYWLLTSHYRTNANFTFEALEAAKQALFRLKRFVFEECKNKSGVPDQTYMDRFTIIMNDDLDTPKAIALMWEVVKAKNLAKDVKVGTLKEMDAVLDIGLGDDPTEVTRELGIVAHEEMPEDVQKLIDERELARSIHNWDESDRLREAINLKGYVVEDTPQGQRISKS
jgi:cysteinyl-tRNA synthetase